MSYSAWDDAMGQVAFFVAVGSLVAVAVVIGGMVFLCYLGYQAYKKRNDPQLGGPWSDRGEFSLEFGNALQFGEAISWD
jgi:hypothetical protein